MIRDACLNSKRRHLLRLDNNWGVEDQLDAATKKVLEKEMSALSYYLVGKHSLTANLSIKFLAKPIYLFFELNEFPIFFDTSRTTSTFPMKPLNDNSPTLKKYSIKSWTPRQIREAL
ncbi:hypothetical protein BpHYR1_029540 [Brachionus plicatilis]|uniref:Uncharacterized protein n=1 Tax=Brachionus plicatilis TaxID=10195 RepID=A0A3M7R7I0_BRAPC|nr:hypothetical protein BpHYR1_029540 [Brachionus plicatilis]